MTININEYYIDRIEYMITIIKNSEPGNRIWRKSDKYSSGFDYGETKRSTFPWWIKFAYEKKPKEYNWLSEEEKKLEPIYFSTNTRDILVTLNNQLKGKRIRTKTREQFLKILFENLYIEEQDWKEKYNEELFDDYVDLSNCPF